MTGAAETEEAIRASRLPPNCSPPAMANRKPDQEIIELFEDGSSDDSQISVLKAKLLHHLVDFSEVFQKKAGDPEIEQLMKKNTGLVSELLSWRTKPAIASESVITNPRVTWKEILQQKLIDAKVNLDDVKVKEFADKQTPEISKRMGELADGFVRGATSFSRWDDKVTLEFDTNPRRLGDDLNIYKTIYLRSLIFNVRFEWACFYSNKMAIVCSGIPANMSCRARIEVKIKNRSGTLDWIRSFCKVFKPENTALIIAPLIGREEFEDQTLGRLNDDKLSIEVAIRTEPVEPAKPVSFGVPLIPAKRQATETTANATKRKA